MRHKFSFLFILFALLTTASANPCFPPFEVNHDYFTGSEVSHNGQNYRAQWTTREIPGVENWGGWKHLGRCSQETLIDLSVRQERHSVQSVSQFLLFASQNLLLHSGVNIAGNIGANGSVSVGNVGAGWQTIVAGDIYSKDAVTTTAEALIKGDVYANSLQLGWQARHDGELIRDHDFNFNIATKNVQPSSLNLRGGWQDTIRPLPGNYRDVSVNDGGMLELRSGTYDIRSLSLNSNNIPIFINLVPGENVHLNIQDNLVLGSGTKVTFAGNVSPLSFKIYTNQTGNLIIPDHSEINAIITAPNAKVIVNSGAKFNGAIFAKEIEVLQGAIINSVPYITDIFHSEYHFSPAFDILTNDYSSWIPSGITPEFVRVAAPENFVVTQTLKGTRHVFEVKDTVTNLVSYYAININPAGLNPAVFVNSNVAVSGDGRNWETPVKTLREAVELAKIRGLRIFLAEGVYDGVEIGQGTKIIGGFLGSERDSQPLGSPYSTVITGRNIFRALTINGFADAKSVKIKGVTIRDGVSTESGGGIFTPNVVPKLEEVIVRNNFATENGAGIFAPRGVQDMQMVLVENNQGKNAFYLGASTSFSDRILAESGRIMAERIVISSNSGDGLFVRNTDISFVNSIFYGNSVGIVAKKNSNLELIHCTFAKNKAGVSSDSSVVRIVNSILWNEGREITGDGVAVSFSAVRSGFAGEGNVAEDPLFVDVENPKGDDGIWGTHDDGLMLKKGSSGIDSGSDFDVLSDITNLLRPLEKNFDMGAYEIALLPEGDTEADFGILNFNNEFIRKVGVGDFAVQASSRRDLYRLRFGRSALTLRVYAPKDAYIKDRVHEANGFVSFQRNGKDIAKPIKVRFHRTGETGSKFIFTSRKFKNGQFDGLPIFIVAETDSNKINALKDESMYYILPIDINGDVSLKVTVPTGQFPR